MVNLFYRYRYIDITQVDTCFKYDIIFHLGHIDGSSVPSYMNSFVVLSTISHSFIPFSSGTKLCSFANLKNFARADKIIR